MSKFLNTLLGIVGAAILGAIFGMDFTAVSIGLNMNDSNEIEDEYTAVILKRAREIGKRLFRR